MGHTYSNQLQKGHTFVINHRSVKEHPLIKLHTVRDLSHLILIFFHSKRKKSTSHKSIAKKSFGGRVEEGEVEAVNDGVLFLDVFGEDWGDGDVGGAFDCEAVWCGSVWFCGELCAYIAMNKYRFNIFFDFLNFVITQRDLSNWNAGVLTFSGNRNNRFWPVEIKPVLP